ncbi:helix-turn-helix transcriptional regulator [Acinetobacter sp. B5B]|uniref:helix-turn-helix domain-containing protein n=1 Tax=Acinetobacter baretiae TaxID=2605383 RepID=UPI0018C29595|nr:AraC family transcriptional regulator [Acinetobacter baretiae]MBF7681952.1 helix-turn-helix transcriptional regulator [Acinetobacter baretiae]
MPILPPGSGCELFIFDKKITVLDTSQSHSIDHVDSILVRPRHGSIQFLSDGPISFIAIRFRLGCINYFTDYLESDCQTLVSPYALWGKYFYKLRENILNNIKISSRVNFIECFLKQNMYLQSVGKIDLANFFLDQLYYNHDRLSLAKLITNTGYSERHLQKTVKLVTGLTLIEVKKLIRFEQTLKAMFSKDVIDVNQAYLYGYYDQSHFIKDFKVFTGMPPMSFLTSHQDSALFYKKMALKHQD